MRLDFSATREPAAPRTEQRGADGLRNVGIVMFIRTRQLRSHVAAYSEKIACNIVSLK